MIKTVTVIEIAEQYLKVVVSSSQGAARPLQLAHCVVEPIKDKSDEDITKKVLDVFKRLKLRPQNVVLSVPRNIVTVRNIHLPSRDKKEIVQMVDLHIPRIVPYKKEEVLFDHRFLGYDEMGYSKELLAIAHIDAVRRQARLLEAAGILVDKMQLSSYGAWQWLVSQRRDELKEQEVYLLLDIDATFIDFIVFSRHSLLFTRSISVGANELAGNTEGAINRVLYDARMSSIFFYDEELNKKPTKAFITGAREVKELPRSVENELGIPVEVVRPAPAGVAKEAPLPDTVSVVAATEMAVNDEGDRISFILPEVQIRKSFKEKARELTILGSLMVYILSIIIALMVGRYYIQQNYLKTLQQHNRLIADDVGDLVEESKRIEFARDILSARKVPLIILRELEDLTPKEIAVNYIGLDESEKVTLRGEGAQLSDVFKFVTSLENSKYFDNVTTKYTRTKKVREREITDFEVGFQFTRKGRVSVPEKQGKR